MGSSAYTGERGNKVADKSEHSVLLATIGLSSPKNILFLVEDECARVLADIILADFEPGGRRRVEYAILSGDGAITNLSRMMPKHRGHFTVHGLYDGDLRGNVPSDVPVGSYSFFPGSNCIEAHLRKAITERRCDFEQETKVHRLESMLFSIAHLEDHDWLRALAESACMDFRQVVRAAVGVWAQDSLVMADLQATAEELGEVIGRVK